MWLEEFTEETMLEKWQCYWQEGCRPGQVDSSEDRECDNGRGVEMVEAKERTNILSPNPLQSQSLDPLETPEPPQTATM